MKYLLYKGRISTKRMTVA